MPGKIILSGLAGSGKSTVGKLLAAKLNYKFISMGDFTRQYANNEFGININQFQEYCLLHPEIDDFLDEKFIEYCNTENKLIIDYRLGFHFIKDTYSVFLKVSDKEARKRISLSGRFDENQFSIITRNKMMKERFQLKYGVDFTDSSKYKITIDTDKYNPEEISQIILSKVII